MHGLIVLWWSVTSLAVSPPLANEDGYNVDDPHYAGNDAVRDRTSFCVISEQESKTTVDDAEGNDDSAEPDMCIRDDCSGLELLEVGVVEETKDWLEEDHDKKKDADDGVRLADVAHLVCEGDS